MNKSLIIGFVTGIAFVFVVLLVPHAISSGRLMAGVASAGSLASTPTTQQISCNRTAIDARENALISANATFEQATNAAYATRASALNAAYSQSSWTAVTAAAQSAFTAFSNTIDQAQASLKTSDETAANNYTAAVAICTNKSVS